MRAQLDRGTESDPLLVRVSTKMAEALFHTLLECPSSHEAHRARLHEIHACDRTIDMVFHSRSGAKVTKFTPRTPHQARGHRLSIRFNSNRTAKRTALRRWRCGTRATCIAAIASFAMLLAEISAKGEAVMVVEYWN
jgi:hypothetical protein